MNLSLTAMGHGKFRLGGACGLMTRTAAGVPGCVLRICKSWPCCTLAFAWLILITILSFASFFSGNVPFDQRTGQPFVGGALVGSRTETRTSGAVALVK